MWLDRGRTRRLDKGFAAFEAWRDKVLEEEERDRHKLDRKIVREEHWLRYGVTARRKRNCAAWPSSTIARRARRDRRDRPVGDVACRPTANRRSGKIVIDAEDISKSFGERTDRQRFLDPHPARRPGRHRRARTAPARRR